MEASILGWRLHNHPGRKMVVAQFVVSLGRCSGYPWKRENHASIVVISHSCLLAPFRPKIQWFNSDAMFATCFGNRRDGPWNPGNCYPNFLQATKFIPNSLILKIFGKCWHATRIRVGVRTDRTNTRPRCRASAGETLNFPQKRKLSSLEVAEEVSLGQSTMPVAQNKGQWIYQSIDRVCFTRRLIFCCFPWNLGSSKVEAIIQVNLC